MTELDWFIIIVGIVLMAAGLFGMKWSKSLFYDANLLGEFLDYKAVEVIGVFAFIFGAALELVWVLIRVIQWS